MAHLVKAIDAHVGGQPLRLLTDGVPRPAGRSVAQRTDWLRRHADHIRTAVVLEPRGHADMVAAVLTEPAAPGAAGAIMFMDGHGYRPMSGHGIIAVATIAVERGLFFSREMEGGALDLAFETAAGTVQARAHVVRTVDRLRVDSVAFTSVPAFVHTAGHTATADGRTLRADVAYAGVFYAIVDTESVGIPLTSARLPDLRRAAVSLANAVNGSISLPRTPAQRGGGIAGVIVTGPAQDPEAHLRTVTITSAGIVNRSPSGTGMAALMSVLDAMGLLPEGGEFVLEGLAGSLFRGRVASRTMVADRPAIRPEIEGAAWITGEHAFVIDEDDPMKDGIAL